MISEWLLNHFGRNLSRHYLRFEDAAGDVELSPPDPGRQYLLYLHIPFCVVLCPFCSFHRVEFREDRASAYFDALRSEIRTASDAGFQFSELYVGGGTPTVMPGQLIETIELVRELHPVNSISTETNPDDLDDERLPELRSVGVNRLSVGVQSFDDRLLSEMERLERYGSGEQIRERLHRVAGLFDTLNIDMIFNFPDQTEASLARDLDILIDDVQAEQVSFYPLMTTNSTEKPMQRRLGNVDHKRERALYRMITERMLAAGYRRSSAWCFARRPTMIDEYIVTQDEYLGLGSGAFSYFGGHLYASTFSINHYIERARGGRSGIVRNRAMSTRNQMRYYLLTRLFSGSIDLAAAEVRFRGRFSRTLRPELLALRSSGAVTAGHGRLQLTERGYYLWVVLMREFFSGVNHFREQMRHNIASERKIRGRTD